MVIDTGRSRPEGAGIAELSVALPLLILLGLGVIQLGLLAMDALIARYAAMGSARYIAARGLDRVTIEAGLMQSTTILYSGVINLRDKPAALLEAKSRGARGFARDRALGFLDWAVLTPTRDSFDDWAESGEGVLGPLRAGMQITDRLPNSGVLTRERGLAVGRQSRQTYLDANTLKLRVTVGAGLTIPVVGPMLADTYAWLRGCGAEPKEKSLGSISIRGSAFLPQPDALSAVECRMLRGLKVEGRHERRFPITVIALAQLQAPVTRSELPN
ncbi:MAG: hypothetical protein EBT03_03225 [Betaproteobacteria bacterium]|nr:hypothetical protein [Betaproteobacteria bacterium]NCA15892.1 hypothetical protein [Betaproteobacteria bacterium]